MRTLVRYAAQPAPAHIGLRLSVAVGRRRVAFRGKTPAVTGLSAQLVTHRGENLNFSQHEAPTATKRYEEPVSGRQTFAKLFYSLGKLAFLTYSVPTCGMSDVSS